MTVLKIEGLSKSFHKKKVLSEISLELGNGIYGLLGPNGSGKTTMIRCICGILKPNGGRVAAPEQIGYLPQRFGVFKELTVYEALEYYASLKKIPPKEQREEILKRLSQVNLKEKEKDRVGSLSGGMVRRLGIAQAFLGEPPLILLDEPTAGLDPEERMRFKTILHRNQSNCCILISTHIVEDVEAVCERVILMDQGKIRKEGAAKDLRESARGMVYTVFEEEEGGLTEPYYIAREDVLEGKVCMRILSPVVQPGRREEPTLEDSYMLYLKGLI